MSTIFRIIKLLRSEPFRLSQTEIARRTSIHQTKISRWESGAISAGAEDAVRLIALARDVGVPETSLAEINPAQPVAADVAQGV